MSKPDGTDDTVAKLLKDLRTAASNGPRPQGTVLVTPVRKTPEPDFLDKLKTRMKGRMADRRKK
jgi:hypothetical protein